jgi:hypothetical protein
MTSPSLQLDKNRGYVKPGLSESFLTTGSAFQATGNRSLICVRYCSVAAFTSMPKIYMIVDTEPLPPCLCLITNVNTIPVIQINAPQELQTEIIKQPNQHSIQNLKQDKMYLWQNMILNIPSKRTSQSSNQVKFVIFIFIALSKYYPIDLMQSFCFFSIARLVDHVWWSCKNVFRAESNPFSIFRDLYCLFNQS